MATREQLIDDLQRIEAGALQELPAELADAINTFFANAKIALKKRKPVIHYCVVCGSDLFVMHHINSYSHVRKYNGDSPHNFLKTLSLIWICPNCHHQVHNKNPYFTKNGGDLIANKFTSEPMKV